MTLVSRLLDALGRAFVARAGDGVTDLVDGLSEPLRDADDRLTTTDRGWAAAFDLDETPEPRWIGTATGTSVPGGLTVEQQRDYVRDRASWRRGSPEAIKGAVRPLLTGTQRVELVERDGGAWRLSVQTYAAETDVDEAVIVAAAESQKPVGIVVTGAEVLTGASYDHLTEEHGTYEDLTAEFPTYDAPAPDPTTATYHVPEEGTTA